MDAWLGLAGVLVGAFIGVGTSLLTEIRRDRRAHRDIEIDAFGRYLASVFLVRSAAVKRVGEGPHRYDADWFRKQIDAAYDELLQAYAYAVLYSQTSELRGVLEEVRLRAATVTGQCLADGFLDGIDEEGRFDRAGEFHALREAQKECVARVQEHLGLPVSAAY